MPRFAAALALLFVPLAFSADSPRPEQVELDQLRAALPSSPEPGNVLFRVAELEIALGHPERAVAAIGQAVDLEQGFDPNGEPAYASLAARPDFKAVAERADRLNPPVVRSRAGFSLGADDLAPEGIAWAPGPDGGTFFVSSIVRHKIVRYDAKNGVRDFVGEGAEGISRVLGLRVDAKRGLLWAAAFSRDGSSGIWAFEIADGHLARKVVRTKAEGGPHLFNDIALAGDDVYFTDSMAGAVNRLDVARGTIEAVGPADYVYPNGIVASPDGRVLFVADWRFGVTRIDLATRARAPLGKPDGVTLAGIDGLSLDRGALVAVQNGIGRPRIARFPLAKELDRVTGAEVLAYRDPALRLPTTAAVAGDSLYVIADAALDRLDGDRFKAGAPRETARVAVVPLR